MSRSLWYLVRTLAAFYDYHVEFDSDDDGSNLRH